jgi:5-methylcytosine-specific restriction endonuclease McrA
VKKFVLVNNVPHPRSPTVDHIIAISLGIKGHTWDNVQCACWQCNVKKGAKAIGQLRMAIC